MLIFDKSTMPGRGSVAPITIQTLDQALHPQIQEDNRPRTGVREPLELHFLSSMELNNLKLSHNWREECCACPIVKVVDMNSSENQLLMKSIQKTTCFTFSHDNIEVFHSPTNELVILIEFIDGMCRFYPSKAQIYAPPGLSLGFIQRYSGSCCVSSLFEYEIKNNSGDILYTVESSTSCWQPSEYLVLTPDGQQVAKICDKILNSYSLELVESLTPSNKALIIGLSLFYEYHRNMYKR